MTGRLVTTHDEFDMELCTYLFSLMIVGAVETRPGIMHVELLDTSTETTEEIYIYTEDYLSCWENGVPVSPAPIATPPLDTIN